MVKRILFFLFFSLVFRLVYVRLFFNFLTTDEAYYVYWLKFYYHGCGDLPLIASSRHYSFSLNVFFLLPVYSALTALFGASENYLWFLTAVKITGVIISALISFVIYILLGYWIRNEVAMILSLFPNIAFIEWTAQFRDYDLSILFMCLGFLFVQRKRSFLSGFCLALATSIVPITLYFFLTITFFLISKHFKFKDYMKFFFGCLLGLTPILLYNLCNIDIYREVSKFKITSIPTLDEMILRIMGWEGWINFQCSMNYKMGFDKLRVLRNIISITEPYNPLLYPSLFLYIPVFFLCFFSAFFHRERKIPIVFLPTIFIALLFSPQDRNMVIISIPVLIILAFGFDYLASVKKLFTLYKIALIIYPLHNLSYAFFNTKDCSGYYMNFEDGKMLQVKNFSCKKKGISEFQKLFLLLKKNNIKLVFSDFIVAPIINALYYPNIKASSQLFISLDWMPEVTNFIYRNIRDEKIAFVISRESKIHTENLSQIRNILLEKGVSFKEEEIDDSLIVYYDFSPEILPDMLWSEVINSLRRCFSNEWGFERKAFGCIKKLIEK